MWIIGFVALWMTGCSVYMEADRPTPVDLTTFKNGDTWDSVYVRLRTPVYQVTDPDGAKCDVYHLYVKGLSKGSGSAIGVTEIWTDILTLGLAEIVWTPMELLTKNHEYPVTFCFKDDKLVRVTVSDTPVPAQP